MQQKNLVMIMLAMLLKNLMYENAYPLVSALSRPLISKKLVEIAEKQIQ